MTPVMWVLATLVVFVMGIIVGMILTHEVDKHQLEIVLKEQREQLEASWKREQDSTIKLLEELTRPPAPPKTATEAVDSVKVRLRKAVEILTKQAQIDTRKGEEYLLLHNELELEKLNILKSILKDGHDPVITIRYNTGDQEMLLSKYVESIQKTLH